MLFRRIVDEDVEAAAALLSGQWAHISAVSWARTLSAGRGSASGGAAAGGLPAHFTARDGGAAGPLVAHGSLHAATVRGDARNVVLQSLVVHPARRRSGIGRQFMARLEAEAAARGFGYLVLCTKDQQAFYSACGYRECDPANIDAPVLATFANVAGLEELLRRRALPPSGEGEGGPGCGPPHAGAGATTTACATAAQSTTWFQKRLRDFPAAVESRWLRFGAGGGSHSSGGSASPHAEADVSSLCAEGLQRVRGWGDVDLARCRQIAAGWRDVLWCRQIGPSCGLTALLIIADTLAAVGGGGAGDAASSLVPPLAAAAAGTRADDLRARLLVDAAAAGWTADGEVFSVRGMLQIARGAGLHAQLWPWPSSPRPDPAAPAPDAAAAAAGPSDDEVAAWVGPRLARALRTGCLALVAYDAADSARGHAPVRAGGVTAHWGVVCGVAGGGDGAEEEAAGCGADGAAEEAEAEAEGAAAAEGDAPARAAAAASPPVLLRRPRPRLPLAVALVHALSARPALCALRDLVASNRQLHAADRRKAALGRWVVGAAGGGGGGGPDLAGLIVIAPAAASAAHAAAAAAAASF